MKTLTRFALQELSAFLKQVVILKGKGFNSVHYPNTKSHNSIYNFMTWEKATLCSLIDISQIIDQHLPSGSISNFAKLDIGFHKPSVASWSSRRIWLLILGKYKWISD